MAASRIARQDVTRSHGATRATNDPCRLGSERVLPQPPKQAVEQLLNRQPTRSLVCEPITEPHPLVAPLPIEVAQ